MFYRLIPFLVLLLCIADCAQAAPRRRGSAAVAATTVSLTDEEVYRFLTDAERASWQAAQKVLKDVVKEKTRAQWLLDRSPGTGSFKIDVSQAHADGKRQMDAAIKREAEANQALQNLRETAQKRSDERALNGPQYVYTDSKLQKSAWNAFAEKAGEKLIKDLHAKGYYAIYYAGVLRWKNGAYVSDPSAHAPLLESMMRADGDDYSLLSVKSFSLKQGEKTAALVPDGYDAPSGKAAVIVAEIVECGDFAPLAGIRAIDYSNWKILLNETCEIDAGDSPERTLRVGDENAFLKRLADAPDVCLFELFFNDPSTPLARACSLLAKDAFFKIKGANTADSDFIRAAYASSGSANSARNAAVNCVWMLAPSIPEPEKVESPEAMQAKLKNMSRAERRKYAEEAAKRAEEAAKNPPLDTLLTASLSAVNLNTQNPKPLEIGVFEVVQPKPPKAEAAAAAADEGSDDSSKRRRR